MSAQLLWERPPQGWHLDHHDCHIWCVSLDPTEPKIHALAAQLSDDEKAKAERLVFAGGRRRFTVARGYLREILGAYLQLPPAVIRFAYGPHGKPILARSLEHFGIHFNVSHSHEIAVCAVSRSEDVGVDVERLQPMKQAQQIAMRFFSPGESELLGETSSDQFLRTFFNLWTCKEAFLKATGTGFAGSMAQVEFALQPDQSATLLSIQGQPEPAREWSVRVLSPAPDYVGAVVIRDLLVNLQCWEWTGHGGGSQ